MARPFDRSFTFDLILPKIDGTISFFQISQINKRMMKRVALSRMFGAVVKFACSSVSFHKNKKLFVEGRAVSSVEGYSYGRPARVHDTVGTRIHTYIHTYVRMYVWMDGFATRQDHSSSAVWLTAVTTGLSDALVNRTVSSSSLLKYS